MNKHATAQLSDRKNPLRGLLCFVLLAVVSTFGEADSDPWLLLDGGERATITARTTRADLVHTYGAANVVDQDVDIGEGETEPGTVVFPNDPMRSIEILWKKVAESRVPKLVTIHGDASRWKTVHDISLGTTLKELEAINHHPFLLLGFAWDYSGTVSSWEGGLLEQELHGKRRVIVRLDSPAQDAATEKDYSQVMGDREFSSQHVAMQKLNPRVYAISWEYP